MTTQSEMTILLKLRDEASKGIKSAGTGIDKFKTQLRAGAVAAAGVGLALEGLARKNAPLLEATAKLALQTGMTAKEIRGMATSLSNATFPLDEAIGLMELAAQQGLKGGEAIKKYAAFWDTVGDATGLSSEMLAKSGAALKAVGIEVGNETKLLKAFGLIQNSTTGSVGDFLTSIQKLAPEMGRVGISIDDAAVILTTLEKELGLTARTARTEFKEALDLNGESLETVLAALGVTTEQTQKYQAVLESSGSVIQANADAHAATKTRLQELQSSLGDVMFTMGPFIQQAAGLAPLLLAIAPAMAFLSVATTVYKNAKKAATIAVRVFGVALKTALGPIGLIIIALGLLTVAIILIIKNWDKIWPKMSKVLNTAINGMIKMFNAVTKVQRLFIEGFLEGIQAIVRVAAKLPVVGGKFDGLADSIQTVIDKVRAGVPRIDIVANAFVDLGADVDRTADEMDVFGSTVERVLGEVAAASTSQTSIVIENLRETGQRFEDTWADATASVQTALDAQHLMTQNAFQQRFNTANEARQRLARINEDELADFEALQIAKAAILSSSFSDLERIVAEGNAKLRDAALLTGLQASGVFGADARAGVLAEAGKVNIGAGVLAAIAAQGTAGIGGPGLTTTGQRVTIAPGISAADLARQGGVTVNGPLVSVTGNVLGADLADLVEVGLIELEQRGIRIRQD